MLGLADQFGVDGLEVEVEPGRGGFGLCERASRCAAGLFEQAFLELQEGVRGWAHANLGEDGQGAYPVGRGIGGKAQVVRKPVGLFQDPGVEVGPVGLGQVADEGGCTPVAGVEDLELIEEARSGKSWARGFEVVPGGEAMETKDIGFTAGKDPGIGSAGVIAGAGFRLEPACEEGQEEEDGGGGECERAGAGEDAGRENTNLPEGRGRDGMERLPAGSPAVEIGGEVRARGVSEGGIGVE